MLLLRSWRLRWISWWRRGSMGVILALWYIVKWNVFNGIPQVQTNIIYSLCRKSSVMWIYVPDIEYFLRINQFVNTITRLMSSFLRIHQLSDQETHFTANIYGNKMLIYIFLDYKMHRENMSLTHVLSMCAIWITAHCPTIHSLTIQLLQL